MEIFGPYGKVEGLKFLEKNSANMCLIKYTKNEEAVNALSWMHGCEICGKKL